jgi:hypothetical protein
MLATVGLGRSRLRHRPGPPKGSLAATEAGLKIGCAVSSARGTRAARQGFPPAVISRPSGSGKAGSGRLGLAAAGMDGSF